METFDRASYFKENMIKKSPIPVVMGTSSHLILGEFHVRGAMRVIDELNFEDNFVAITNAVIYSQNGKKLLQTDFVAVNRDEIVWLAPKKEVESARVFESQELGG